MSESQKISNLVGDIYDAALDPAMWVGVLARIADFAGGRTGALAMKDSASAFIEAHYQFGIDPDYMQVYAVLEKSVTGRAFLGVVRDEAGGMADDEMRRRIAIIAPHVRRAILVGKAIHFKRAKAAALAETLDGLSAGMFLVDGRGHIIHANVAGRLILGADDFLRSIRGQLVAGDAQVNQTLREILAIAE
jgi:PAS domain-containing protein